MVRTAVSSLLQHLRFTIFELNHLQPCISATAFVIHCKNAVSGTKCRAVKMFQTRMYLSVCSRLLHFFIKSPIFARCSIVKLTQKNCNCSSLLDILLLLCLLKSCINYFPLAFTAFTLTDLMWVRWVKLFSSLFITVNALIWLKMHLWMHLTKPELLGVCSKHEFSGPCLEFWCVYDSYYLHFYITELETYNWLWFEDAEMHCCHVSSFSAAACRQYPRLVFKYFPQQTSSWLSFQSTESTSRRSGDTHLH